MNVTRFAPLLIGTAMFSAVAAAQAPAAPPTTAPTAAAPSTGIAAGQIIYDPQGGEVGTVESISGENIVVNTGTNRATLASNAFSTGPKGPVLNTTRAQLDSAVADAASKAKAATKTALVADAEVRGKDGTVVGKIKVVEGANVVLERPAGPVSVPNQYFTTDANGLVLTITSAELDTAARAATAPTGNASSR